MKNGWIWVPVAGVLGLIVGAWGPREELREREKKAAEEKVKAAEEARTSRGAFKSFAQMVNIPDEARRPRRRGQQKRPSKPAVVVSTNAAPAKAVAKDEMPQEASAPEEPPRQPPAPNDLRARIEEAQEMWRARSDVARAQWKAKLSLDAAASEKFDAAIDEMNSQLRDTMQALADQVANSDKFTQELGLRLVGDATTIMAETYDKLGAVAPGARTMVSDIQMTDFIDPGVAEPLISVQGKMESLPIGRRAGRR